MVFTPYDKIFCNITTSIEQQVGWKRLYILDKIGDESKRMFSKVPENYLESGMHVQKADLLIT